MCPQHPDPSLEQPGLGFMSDSVQAVVAGGGVLAVPPGSRH